MRRGASLIELMVAGAVLATVAAIAITSYQQAQDRTYDNATSANLQAAASAQLSHNRARGRYALTPEDIQSLSVQEITVTAGPSTGPSEISVSEGEGGTLILVSRSASRNCLLLRLSPQEQDMETQDLGPVNCTASSYYQP